MVISNHSELSKYWGITTHNNDSEMTTEALGEWEKWPPVPDKRILLNYRANDDDDDDD